MRWATPALIDFEQIGDYISKESTNRAASRVLGLIEDCSATLIDHPEIGRVGRVPGTRELVVARLPYVVAYRVVENELQILAVFHGSRKWP